MSKDDYPCDSYVLDMSASTFGACKCGWSKPDHSKSFPDKPTGYKAKYQLASEIVVPTGPQPPPLPPPPKPCEKFQADVTKDFGMCTCGFTKNDHGKKIVEAEHLQVHLAPQGAGVAEKVAQAKDDVAGVFFASSSAKRPSYTTATSGGPCNSFTLNMTGEFGKCVCGYTKEEHKKKEREEETNRIIQHALQPSSSPPQETRRATITAKGRKSDVPSKKACDNYTVDINAKNFGDCLCGHPKAAHFKKDSKFNNTDPNAAEVEEEIEQLPEPEVIIRDGVNCCTKFELDLASTGFKVCLCGFSQADHDKRKTMSHEQYKQMRAMLQKPKDFT